jgi:hypothetical protein
VPGDYPDLATALASLSQLGGTICLAAGNYSLPQSSIFGAYPTKSLSIIGASAETTTVGSEFTTSDDQDRSRATPMTLHLQGITFSAGLQITTHSPFHDNYELIALRVAGKVDNVSAPGLSLEINSNGGSSVLIDGCDFSCPACDSVGLYPNGFSPAPQGAILIENSYFHDSESAVLLADDFSGVIQVVNNDFKGNQATLWGGGISGLLYANNLFWNNGVVQGGQIPGATGVHHHNGYFNSGAVAMTSPGDVKGFDPTIDATTTPGEPGANSPLRGAADPALAPKHDYWGNPRRVTPDIGAVEHW